MSRFSIDHVGLLVRSIEHALERLDLSASRDLIEEFPAGGTREIYVGDADGAGRFLLMQPSGAGPYERAMRKRGHGLHHVAFSVRDLASFAESIEGSGWLLHPASLRLVELSRQI